MGVVKAKLGKPTMFLFLSLLVNTSRFRFLSPRCRSLQVRKKHQFFLNCPIPLSPQMGHHRPEFIRFTKASNLNLLLTFVVPL